MKARLRVLVVAAAGLLAAGAPALAQDQQSAAPAQTQPPAQGDLIGNPQLKDFSIKGTVTRAAPAPVQVRPVSKQSARSAPAQETQSAPVQPPAPNRDQTRTAARAAPEPDATTASSSPGSTAADLPSAPSPQQSGAASSDISASAPPLPQPDTAPPASGEFDFARFGFSMLPWLVAALMSAGAAGWHFFRQRPRPRLATSASAELLDSLSPVPAPQPQPPSSPLSVPAEPAPPQPAGIVSTRLRPWLEIEFRPDRAVVDDERAAIAFELSVFNSGSAPARDVLLEASLFNAGPMQDQQIRLFFENPVGKGDRMPVIAPMQRVTVNSAVFLLRDQVRPIEIEGRLLFVPMIAFNALYGWGRTTGQSSASYLVGKTTGGEKLAPFRLDLGPRIFRNLDAREHELRLRK
jgi:hypothetical protein